ncbi:dipeptide epimerase [Sandaracinobacter neustonicus]|uniref:Dipeptide epimerase n=1 Tax=Sandaracinobacter neustonicus TaxID=1715348 RepID=A0A501XJL9_9SPHN|nr:dipeptide epimerase [Sandaracinobacter neustonicus]TPE60493.1 dipeptide epimerase [Sandaracinobacter neustonicus]
MNADPATSAASLRVTGYTVERECWAYRTPLVHARGTDRIAELIVVTLQGAHQAGRGESCPIPHHGESVEGVRAQVNAICQALVDGADWGELHDRLPAGAARNAVDCAIWDLRARTAGVPVSTLMGLPAPNPVSTVYTIGLAAPDEMARAAAAAAALHDVVKIKLGDGGDDLARLRAIRAMGPGTRLIADANEGWTASQLVSALPELAALGVEMLEQPLPAGRDLALASIDRIIPIGADESCHVEADLPGLVGRYDLVNIKLDKSGGLTEAMRLQARAEALGFATMVGCMCGTSLGMAPALLVAQRCRYVDLDAPLLLGLDRTPSLGWQGQRLSPVRALWGG